MIKVIDGIDVSTWQDAESTPQHMDFTKSVSMGAKFVFVKISQRLFKDADFVWNWYPAKQAGLLRGGYHFLTWDVSGKLQAEWMWSIIQNDPGELPMVADFEMPTGASSTSKLVLFDFLNRIASLSGKVPMIYTSNGFWKVWGTKDPAILRYPLWIANYGVSEPGIPLPWTQCTFWQDTDRADGLAYGAESKSIDHNWFNGTSDQFYQFAGVNAPVDYTDKQKLDKIWAAHPELH